MVTSFFWDKDLSSLHHYANQYCNACMIVTVELRQPSVEQVRQYFGQASMLTSPTLFVPAMLASHYFLASNRRNTKMTTTQLDLLSQCQPTSSPWQESPSLSSSIVCPGGLSSIHVARIPLQLRLFSIFDNILSTKVFLSVYELMVDPNLHPRNLKISWNAGMSGISSLHLIILNLMDLQKLQSSPSNTSFPR